MSPANTDQKFLISEPLRLCGFIPIAGFRITLQPPMALISRGRGRRGWLHPKRILVTCFWWAHGDPVKRLLCAPIFSVCLCGYVFIEAGILSGEEPAKKNVPIEGGGQEQAFAIYRAKFADMVSRRPVGEVIDKAAAVEVVKATKRLIAETSKDADTIGRKWAQFARPTGSAGLANEEPEREVLKQFTDENVNESLKRVAAAEALRDAILKIQPGGVDRLYLALRIYVQRYAELCTIDRAPSKEGLTRAAYSLR